jgi:hypothetical protein
MLIVIAKSYRLCSRMQVTPEAAAVSIYEVLRKAALPSSGKI